MSRYHRWLLVVGVAVLVAIIAVPAVSLGTFMVSQTVGRTTVVADGAGGERTVYWREYPGVAGINTQELLDGPSVDEAYAAGEAMVAQMRAALSAEFGLEWAPDPNAGDNGGPFFERVQNWYGGQSLLTGVNAPTSQSTSVPTSWADKERVIEIIGEVASDFGFGVPVLEHDQLPARTDEDRLRELGGLTPETQVLVTGMVEGPTGQWLSFMLQDLSKDTDGRFETRLDTSKSQGWQLNTINLSYGANALLPEQLRDEFERRLEPFRGLTQPPPLET